MGADRVNFARAPFFDFLRHGGKRTGRVHDVIKNNGGFACYVPNDVIDYRFVGFGAAFINNYKPRIQPRRKLAGAFHAPNVGRNNYKIGMVNILKIIQKHFAGAQVVHGNIKKPLDLACVQIYRHNAVRPGFGN